MSDHDQPSRPEAGEPEGPDWWQRVSEPGPRFRAPEAEEGWGPARNPFAPFDDRAATPLAAEPTGRDRWVNDDRRETERAWGVPGPATFAPPQTQPGPGVRQPQPAVSGGPGTRPAPARGGRMVLTAALTALVVGGAAGFGGARLATGSSSTAGLQPSLAAGSAPAPVPAAQAGSVAAVADAVLPSTVTISFRSGSRSGTGSGFLIDDQGHVMTNNHVVEGVANGGRLQVRFADGRTTAAEIVGRSPSYDLAIIKLQSSNGVRPLVLGDSATARPGQTVVAVGAPLGLGGTVTSGIVSAVDRPLSVGGGSSTDDATAYINGVQTDASINPGNSGGPLADQQGRVIGVNSAILTAGGNSASGSAGGNIGLGFAIPINQARLIAEQLMTSGRATYPVIGATVSAGEVGVRLGSVSSGGPAQAAGLRSGDEVLAINGKQVSTPTELIVQIRTHRPGEQVRLSRATGDEVTITLGEQVG